VYVDAFEIIAEKARRFWWGQQIELGMVPWSLLLSIEGRRRNIPVPWAFLALAHLVSLSFAQNLFYIAMLLAPSPLPSDYNQTPSTSRFVLSYQSLRNTELVLTVVTQILSCYQFNVSTQADKLVPQSHNLSVDIHPEFRHESFLAIRCGHAVVLDCATPRPMSHLRTIDCTNCDTCDLGDHPSTST
jgi:hypothetical protein